MLSLVVFKLSLYVFDAPESPFGFSLLFYLKPWTHDQDLRIRKFCIREQKYFLISFTWLLRISRICQKLKFYSVKAMDISFNSWHA